MKEIIINTFQILTTFPYDILKISPKHEYLALLRNNRLTIISLIKKYQHTIENVITFNWTHYQHSEMLIYQTKQNIYFFDPSNESKPFGFGFGVQPNSPFEGIENETNKQQNSSFNMEEIDDDNNDDDDNENFEDENDDENSSTSSSSLSSNNNENNESNSLNKSGDFYKMKRKEKQEKRKTKNVENKPKKNKMKKAKNNKKGGKRNKK